MEDEEVVFENSALHQHLKDAGFSEADIGSETLRAFEEEERAKLIDDEEPTKRKGFKDKLKGVAKTAWTWLKGGDSWTPEVQQLHQKYADEATDLVLKSSMMEDEDNMFLESFANACMQDRIEEPVEGLVSHIFMQMGILGIAVAYGGFRLIYLKSDDAIKYVWYIDVLSVLLTIAALLPATVRFTSAGRVIGKLGIFKRKVLDQLAELERLHRLCKRTVRLVQEAELVARGFTMVSPMSPIARLEQGSLHHALRQCPQLRKVFFHSCRDTMLKYKKATAELLKIYPDNVELEGMSNYLANLPLEEYGPFIQLQGEEKEQELREVTDGYSLSALKAIIHLCNVHVSEFLRVLGIGWLVKAEDKTQPPGFSDVVAIFSEVKTELHKHVRAIEKQYTLHKYVVMEKDSPQKPVFQQSNVATAYIAVHSLSLHLQAALKKVQRLEDELEPHREEDDLKKASVSSDQLLKELEAAQHDLEACKNCWEEGIGRLEKLAGKHTNKGRIQKKTCPEEAATSDGSETFRGDKTPIPLFEMGEPLIEDQVFEAYTDPDERETSHYVDDFLSEEERAKKKQEKQEAMRVLTELRTVIAVRAQDREDREKKALQRQNPGTQVELPTEDNKSTQDVMNDTPVPCDSNKESPNMQNQSENLSKTDENLIGMKDYKSCLDKEHRNTGNSQEIPELPDLKAKLQNLPGAGLPFTANVAAMAAARSQQMAALSVDTFGDDDGDDDDDDGADKLTAQESN